MTWHNPKQDRFLASHDNSWHRLHSLSLDLLAFHHFDWCLRCRPGNPQVKWRFRAKINCNFREFSSTPCLITGRIWKVTKKWWFVLWLWGELGYPTRKPTCAGIWDHLQASDCPKKMNKHQTRSWSWYHLSKNTYFWWVWYTKIPYK